MGQPELTSSFGVAGGSSRDLKDSQSVERRKTTH
jgi:hypothetical protein